MWYSAHEILPWSKTFPQVVGTPHSIRRLGKSPPSGGSMASLTRWLADWHEQKIYGRGADLIRFGARCDIDNSKGEQQS